MSKKFYSPLQIVKSLFLFTLVFNFSNLNAQSADLPDFVKDSLQNYINEGMKEWQIPGMAVAIIKDDKVIHLQGYGKVDNQGGHSVNEHTLFMIGSNTKAFTSTALAILQNEGKLKLSDNARKWMPEFKLKDELATEEVTIKDLLSHRIGFETFQGDFTYWTSNLSRAEVIQKMSLIDAPYSFRSRWGYCNAAYTTAGEIIPKAIGKSWEATIREKIVEPLDMKRTLALSTELEDAKNVARPHTFVNQKLAPISIPNIDNLAAAGSISSSARDMSQWVQALLNMGKVKGEEVLPASAIQATREPLTILGVDTRFQKATHFYLYGLGWMINDRSGKLVFSHTGGVNGYLSSVMLVPEENLGIIVLTNTDQNNFYQDLTNEIRDAFLDLPYQNYSAKSLTGFKAEKKEEYSRIDSLRNIALLNNPPLLDLNAYTGKYEHPVYGFVVVKKEMKGLGIYFSRHPNMFAVLEYTNDNKFLCTYSDPGMGIFEIPFHVDEDNKVTGFTLKFNDFVELRPYEFTKWE